MIFFGETYTIVIFIKCYYNLLLIDSQINIYTIYKV